MISIHPQKKILLGFWNAQQYPLLLGSVIIFIQELMIQSYQLHDYSIHLAILVDDQTPQTTLKALDAFYQIDPSRIFHNQKDFDHYLNECDEPRWPTAETSFHRMSYTGSTLAIQEYFDQSRFLPRVMLKDSLIKEATSFLNQHAFGLLKVGVHLKNTLDKESLGQANMEEWYQFFSKMSGHRDIKFFLVGDDQVDPRIQSFKNICVVKDFKPSLELYLGIIKQADFFLGTASGPSNIAILGDKPYLIFKDPRQHPEAMSKELKGLDHFVFSFGFQKILRRPQLFKEIWDQFSFWVNEQGMVLR